MPNARGRPKKPQDPDFEVKTAVAEAMAAAAVEDTIESWELQLQAVARLRGKAEKDRSWGAAAALVKVEHEMIRRVRVHREDEERVRLRGY